MEIVLKSIIYRYKSKTILDKISLNIHSNKITGVMGEHKTLLLELIDAVDEPDSGEIKVKGKQIDEYDLIELRRGIGYVIQQIGLLPHLTVEDNICFVLDLLKRPETEKKSVPKELIKLVGMDENMLRRYPKELSGGQQQRVGVARALAADPEIILMDEPFGAVDEITRRNLQDELIKIHSKLKKTIIFVTHDIEEAIKLGTRIVLLNNGVIERNEKKRDFVLVNDRSEYAKKFFESKDFMAYLNTIKIKDLVIKQSDISFDLYDSSSVVKYDATVLQGIQKSIELGKETILTVDEENNPYGWFSLTEIYKRLIIK